MALLIRSLHRAALAVAMAAALSVSAGTAGRQTMELDVKAAYLYNFTKFVEWPASAAPSSEFRICIVGDPAFASAIDAIIKGEQTAGRRLARIEPASATAARECQILFIGRQAPDGSALLASVLHSPVLTVGDTAAFLDQGGVIRFVLEDHRVRFDINTAAADRAGLRISSKLLRVARRLKGSA